MPTDCLVRTSAGARRTNDLLRLAFAAFIVCCTACSAGRGPSPLIGRPAPRVRYTLLDGSRHSSDELAGKTVVMTFWASWCAYSRPVIGELARIAERHAGRNDVAFLAVSIDEERDLGTLEERIKYGQLAPLTHVFSGNGLEDETFLAYNPDVLPHIFVIKDGIVSAEGHRAGFVEDHLR